MGIDNLIMDDSLQPLLKTSQSVLAQSQSMIDWLQEHGNTTPPSLDLQLELAQQQKVMHAYLTKLRGLHRKAMFSARDTKQLTAEARQEVDRLLLQLQNLYYEQRHLMGEIGACEGYELASLLDSITTY
jgi:THO complex subunit 5